MNPELLQMRRLVIAEADRFPQIGREYYARSWVRTLDLLADTLTRLTERDVTRPSSAGRKRTSSRPRPTSKSVTGAPAPAPAD